MTPVKIDNISEETHVTFPAGSTREESNILWAGIAEISGDSGSEAREILLTQSTPFHPIDHTWPDQPGDSGVIEVGGHSYDVTDCLTGAVSKTDGTFLLGRSIPVRRGDPDWMFVAAHVIRGTGRDLRPLAGADAVLKVDAARRLLLSASHTSCHLMALALNMSVRHLWRKEVQADSLGNPNFDQAAIEESRITTEASVDRYRVGKSIRKKGLDASALLADLTSVQAATGEHLREWLKQDAPVTIQAPAGNLSEVRIWTCALSEGTVSLPCGGTHLQNLRQLEGIEVTIDAHETDPEFTVRSIPRLKC